MEPFALWIALLFLGGVFFGILWEADSQARRRAAEAQRLRETMQRKLPLLLLGLLLLPAPAWAAPRPKPRPRLTPEQQLQQELQRFPSREVCQAYIDLADEHLRYLDYQALLKPYLRADILEYRQQVVTWRYLWDDLRLAQSKPFLESDWARLDRIRAAIGEDAYAAGFLWPPVAAHWLIRIDE